MSTKQKSAPKLDTLKDVIAIHPRALTDDMVESSNASRTAIGMLIALRGQLAMLEKQAEGLKAVIAYDIGANKGIEFDTHTVYWGNVERDVFDLERFRDEHPKIAEKYLTVSHNRRFDIRVKKGEVHG